MPSSIVFGAAGVAAAAFAAAGLLTRWLRGVRPQRHAVREAREGELVELSGIVRSAEERAPFSGVACAKWHVRVEVVEQQSDGRFARLLAEDESTADFVLEDESGCARVLGAKIEFDTAGRWERGAVPETVREFLRARGHAASGLLRWRERRLEDGERVTLVGIARWERDASVAGTTYRESGRRLVLDAPELGWIVVR